MKLKVLYLLIIIKLFSLALLAQNTAPEITNVRFEQRTDGTHMVDVYYDVSDAEQSSVSVTVEVSNDAGTTFDFIATSLTGDIGKNIAIGTNNHIIWDFATDHPDFYSNQIQIKVKADDLVGIPCPGVETIAYGGQTYNTVQISDQCWLKENLNIGEKIFTYQTNQSDNGVIEKFCYDNNNSNCEKYGGLYHWDEAMQYAQTEGAQGICPSGWHIPTQEEINKLLDYVNYKPEKLIEENENINYGSDNDRNVTNFTALFVGIRTFFSDPWRGAGYYTKIWSSTAYNNDDSHYLSLSSSNSSVWYAPTWEKAYGLSVRCIKD